MSNEILLTEDIEAFAVHKLESSNSTTDIDKTYDASLLLQEIALFSSAHQRSLALILTLATAGKLLLPFIIRGVIYKTFMLDWDSAIYSSIETVVLILFLL